MQPEAQLTSPGPEITETETPTARDAQKVVVIGGGPVGIRTAQELVQRGQQVTVLSGEAVTPYNRVRLTPLLSGDVQFGDIILPDLDTLGDGFTLVEGMRVVAIDRDTQQVVTADGGTWPFDKLVVATGSNAFVPRIPGVDLPGVFTFRTADDAAALLARSLSARKVAVIGGGLLGLEAAKGMRARGCEVTVIEHEARLMPRQLDSGGGARLALQIEDIGVAVRTGIAVKSIDGEFRVNRLTLSDGSEIQCDTVIVCTGVRANISLAQGAKLAFGRGVIVNDQMQTSDPDIFAVGECSEHQGQMYGLVGPGYAQAEVAAEQIAGNHVAFVGQTPATKLKVIGADVFSAGPVEQLDASAAIKSHVWEDNLGYRRVFLDRGKLVGAIAVGPCPQASRLQDGVEQQITVYPWMLHRFRKTGQLWLEGEQAVDAMPDTATVCNCTGVTCGAIRKAINNGCGTVDAVSFETGAATVCGTCRPLVEDLIDVGGKPKPMPLWKPVLALSSIAGLGALYPLLAGHVPLPTSFDADSLRVWLWRDNIVKQWSGFILLGLFVSAMVIGLRKRIRWTDRLGSFDAWRLVHLGIGIAAIIGFVAHTGFRLGSNLNMALGLGFILTAVFGAIAGLTTGGDHELRARRIGNSRNPPRKLPTWVHILTIWPLPVLILLHVLASYAF